MKKAFTLIELMVVISIIAILSTIALVGFRQAQNSAKDTKKIATIVGFQSALERYYSDQAAATYPATASIVTVYSSLVTAGYLSTAMASLPADSRLVDCAIPCVVANAPCANYVGGTTYTVTFCKSGGGSTVYQNPQ